MRDSHTRRLPRDPLLVNNSLRDNGRAAASRVLLSLRVGDGRRLPPGGTVRLNVGAPYATPMPPQTETPLLGRSSLRISRCNKSGCGSSSSSFSNGRIFSGEEGTSFSNKVFLIDSINWKRAVINERIYGGKNDREIGERNPSISLGAINPRSREVLTHPDPYRSCPLSRCTGKGKVSERQVSLGWPADKSLHV